MPDTTASARDYWLDRESAIDRHLRSKHLDRAKFARAHGIPVTTFSAFVRGDRPNHQDSVNALEISGFQEDRDTDGSLIGAPMRRDLCESQESTDAPAGDHQPSSVASANTSTIGVSTQPREAAS